MDSKNEAEVVKKKQSPVLLIVGIAGILLVGAAIAGLFLFINVAKPKMQIKQQFAQAEKYISDLDYERAILAYEEILLIDPKNTDAYIGILEAYDALTVASIAEADYTQAAIYLENEKNTLERGDEYLPEEEVSRWREIISSREEEIAIGQNPPVLTEETEIGQEEIPEEQPETASVNYEYETAKEVLSQDAAGIMAWYQKNCGVEATKVDDTDTYFAYLDPPQYVIVNGFAIPYDRVWVLMNNQGLADTVHYVYDGFDSSRFEELIQAVEGVFGPTTSSGNNYYAWMTDDCQIEIQGDYDFKRVELSIKKL